MYKLNACLMSAVIFAAFLLFFVPVAAAQDVSAEPVVNVTEETLNEPKGGGSGPVLIELFSSQACFFCPQADRLFADLIEQKHIIGLACHVDYFDVDENALSHPFCTARQKFYMERLKAGVPYTPQMVMNGVRDVVGYKFEHINRALGDAETRSEIAIERNGEDSYTASFSALDSESMDLWLAVYDKPQDITIAEGRNRGNKVTYYNIVSRIEKTGKWDGTEQTQDIAPALSEENAGFVLMAQDSETGQVMAVGHYKR